MTSPSLAAAGSLDRRAYWFLGATCVSVIGTGFGLLGATAATTAAGGADRSGFTSGLFMAMVFLGTAVAIPYSPSIAARLGGRRAFTAAQLANALLFLVAGLLLLADAPTLATLLVAAPLMGMCSGVSSVLRTLVSKSYQSSDNTARSYARLSVALGIAGGIGGLCGGLLLSHVAFGWGLVINALLTIPLLVVLTRVTPGIEPPTPPRTARPWRSAARRLASNRRLRWSAALGSSSVLLLAPVIALVVPVAESLRQVPAVGAAGVLMASFAAGEIFAPWSVAFAQRRTDDLTGGEIAGAIAGALLIIFGIASAFLSQRPELVAWILLGVPFGIFRFAARALYVGTTADAGDDPAGNLASANTVVFLAAPVGTFLFGLSLDHDVVYLPLVASGALAIAWNLSSMRVVGNGRITVEKGNPAGESP
jgi:MFS family permease